MDIFTILMTIGGSLMVLSCIPTIGTSKAERLGKVAVSDKTKLRIKISSILAVAGVAVCILAVILSNFM